MLKPGNLEPPGFGLFSIFAALGGLTFLMVANHVAPGCTGPEVRRCDYVATAKTALAVSTDAYARFHPFSPDRGFDVFDYGSSVLVQQSDPFDGDDWLGHGSAVLIDKKSCRPCETGYAYPDVEERGPLILKAPAEDPIAAAKLSEQIKRWRLGLD
ncbi:hypothetical protein [Brevundimonas bullata]|uniref:hypothetical protein n=1 Tax=Brevundimonas bullata TaxID=13160 RepID=UPI002FDB62F0